MIIMRVVKQIFFVLSVSLCFRSYSGGDNPHSHRYDGRRVRTPKQIVVPLRGCISQRRPTHVCWTVWEVSPQTSRVRQVKNDVRGFSW